MITRMAKKWLMDRKRINIQTARFKTLRSHMVSKRSNNYHGRESKRSLTSEQFEKLKDIESKLPSI